MAVRTKQYDKNRWKKTYPRFRKEPRPGLMADGHVILDALLVNFDNEDSKTVSFSGYYSNEIPSVSLTPYGDINNVNVFITGITVVGSVPAGHGKTVNVTIEASAAFTGQVHVQVFQA